MVGSCGLQKRVTFLVAFHFMKRRQERLDSISFGYFDDIIIATGTINIIWLGNARGVQVLSAEDLKLNSMR